MQCEPCYESRGPPVPTTATSPVQAATTSGASSWRPHVLLPEDAASTDWVQALELDTAKAMLQPEQAPPKILVLYGSLRTRSYSRLLAYEFARILDHLGAEVRVYNPAELPIRDQCTDQHPKVTAVAMMLLLAGSLLPCCWLFGHLS